MIDGVNHELLRIDGIAESTAEIAINARKLVFGVGEACVAGSVVKAAARTAGWPMTGGSIILPRGMWVVNKEQHLCYVDQDLEVRAELVIAKASGHMCAADVYARFGSYLKGCVVVDASFSPVKRVSFEIVTPELNLGDCENVEITIETNGAINIASAVKRACAALADQLVSIEGALGEAST